MKEIKDMRESAGLTRTEMSEKFDIPKRTIEEWEGGRRKCPIYVTEMLKCLINGGIKQMPELKDIITALELYMKPYNGIEETTSMSVCETDMIEIKKSFEKVIATLKREYEVELNQIAHSESTIEMEEGNI